MMTPSGGIKLTDFGLASALTSAGWSADSTLTTATGDISLAYCSPEQANEEPLTFHTDMWSWGLTVLEMFQGQRTWENGIIAPYSLETYLKTEPINLQLPQMPDSVAELLQHCLQEDPEKRPANMLNVASTMEKIYQEEIGIAYPATLPNIGQETTDSLNNRAVCLLDLGRQEEALDLIDRVLAIEPEHLEANYNQTVVLSRQGKIPNQSQVVKQMEQVREFHRGNWLADYALALIYLQWGHGEKALEILKGIEDEEEVSSLLTSLEQKALVSTKLLRTFSGHQSRVNSACLSWNKKLALSGSNDNTLKLWDTSQGTCLHTYRGHHDSIYSVCLSRDAKFALSGSYDKTLKLWDTQQEKCLLTLSGHKSAVTLSISK